MSRFSFVSPTSCNSRQWAYSLFKLCHVLTYFWEVCFLFGSWSYWSGIYKQEGGCWNAIQALGSLQNWLGSRPSGFSSLGEGLYLGKRPAFPRAVGAPFWNHRPDLVAVITSRAECQTPRILDVMTVSSRSPSFLSCGKRGSGEGADSCLLELGF